MAEFYRVLREFSTVMREPLTSTHRPPKNRIPPHSRGTGFLQREMYDQKTRYGTPHQFAEYGAASSNSVAFVRATTTAWKYPA